jgi:hypothetical protein
LRDAASIPGGRSEVGPPAHRDHWQLPQQQCSRLSYRPGTSNYRDSM